MLGLLGLRVSEACNVRIQDIHGLERGHRTLTLVGKGRKPAYKVFGFIDGSPNRN